jgi:hypothetical protein
MHMMGSSTVDVSRTVEVGFVWRTIKSRSKLNLETVWPTRKMNKPDWEYKLLHWLDGPTCRVHLYPNPSSPNKKLLVNGGTGAADMGRGSGRQPTLVGGGRDGKGEGMGTGKQRWRSWSIDGLTPGTNGRSSQAVAPPIQIGPPPLGCVLPSVRSATSPRPARPRPA